MAKNSAGIHQGGGGGGQASRVPGSWRVHRHVSALVVERFGYYSSDTFPTLSAINCITLWAFGVNNFESMFNYFFFLFLFLAQRWRQERFNTFVFWLFSPLAKGQRMGRSRTVEQFTRAAQSKIAKLGESIKEIQLSHSTASVHHDLRQQLNQSDQRMI